MKIEGVLLRIKNFSLFWFCFGVFVGGVVWIESGAIVRVCVKLLGYLTHDALFHPPCVTLNYSHPQTHTHRVIRGSRFWFAEPPCPVTHP